MEIFYDYRKTETPSSPWNTCADYNRLSLSIGFYSCLIINAETEKLSPNTVS